MKGFKNAQEAMLTLAVVLIVTTSVAMTYVYLQTIKVPEGFEKKISGDANEIASSVARHISACYTTHKSSGDKREDCYVLHIYTNGAVTKKDVLNKIPPELISLKDISFTDNGQYIAAKNSNTTIKITYYGKGPEKEIIVTKVDEIL